MDDYRTAVDPAPGGVTMRVRVVPRAKVTAVDGLHGTALKVRVAAPPAGGKANAALLGLLADVLGVRARDLEIVRGAGSRDKTVRATGVRPTAAVCRLRRAAAG